MEWTIDWGWTHDLDAVVVHVPNSSWASITSSPLFISVEESTVIFGPICQVGWARASVHGHLSQRSRGSPTPGTGPPLAVSTMRVRADGRLLR